MDPSFTSAALFSVQMCPFPGEWEDGKPRVHIWPLETSCAQELQMLSREKHLGCLERGSQKFMEREPVPSGARELPWGKTPSRSPSPSVSLLCHSTAAETPARAPTKIPEGQIHKETFRDNHGYRKLQHKHGAIHPNPFIRSWPPIPGHPQHSIPPASLVPQFPLPQSGNAGSGTSLASCLSFSSYKAGMLGSFPARLAHSRPCCSIQD